MSAFFICGHAKRRTNKMRSISIDALRQREIEMIAVGEKLLNVAQSANRDLNNSEKAQFDQNSVALAKNRVALREAEVVLDRERNGGQALQIFEDGGRGGISSSVRSRNSFGPKRGKSTYSEIFGLDALPDNGFRSAGEFFTSVNRAQTIADPRLLVSSGFSAAAGAQREAQPSQGGFLIPDQFAAKILDESLENEIVRPRAQIWAMTGNSLKIPAIDGFVHSGGAPTSAVLYGGIVAAWQNELDSLKLENLKLRLMELHTNKLALLVNSSNELLDDSDFFGTMLDTKLKIAASFFLDQAFLFGTGTGQPLGVINDPALITVPIESGQTLANGPFLYQNCVKMFSRLHPSVRKTACWVANSDLIPALLEMQLVVKNVAGTENVGGSAVPVVTHRPDGTMELLTLPIYFSEKVSPVGTVGDIILASFSEYAIGIRKEIEIQRSIHAGFANDSTWFRLVTRLDGQGTWKSAVTPASGQTLSWAVTLAERS
jgi:HK97 family phage major capsid protein